MMPQIWVVICIAIMIVMANGNVHDLHIEVNSVQTRFAAAEHVNVIVKYSNIGSDTMTIYKWLLPEKELCDPVFEVTRNGKQVEYVGPLVKRRAPTAEDVIHLTPGMTVSTIIKLSSSYDMTQTGNYMIQFKMNADKMLLTMDTIPNRDTIPSNDDQEFVIQSAPIVLFAVGRQNPQPDGSSAGMRALPATYISCTAARTSAIATSITAAENYARGAVQHLNGPASGTTRYTTWFGTFLAANWNRVQSHFTKVQNILSGQTLSFDCSCPAAGDNTYAYVYANQPYRIYLCGAFWPSATTGVDSKGGTIIHEIAHFTVAAGTQDYAYGQSACQALARTNPARAIMNSDNLQYFAENT